MGKPKLDIDEEEVRKLAKFGLSNVDMGEFFGCSEATIRQRFHESLAKGRAERKITLHQRQYEAADAGNITMLIWLGKQVLGQTDKMETKHEVNALVAPAEQRAMLGNERALKLACDLDAELGRIPALPAPAGDDPGGVRVPGE